MTNVFTEPYYNLQEVVLVILLDALFTNAIIAAFSDCLYHFWIWAFFIIPI